jgi:signal transduction histidine kinase
MPRQPTIDVPAQLSTARARGGALHAPARWTLEAVFAVAFVIAVYEALVAGELRIWPNAPDHWILPVWVLAASLSGLGLGPVRRLAGALLRRLWPAAAQDPYAALARTVAQARRTEPAEYALDRLAAIAAESTGARAAVVTPPDGAAPAGADAFPIRADGRVLGELVLAPPGSRPLTDADRRLAATLADAAGALLRNRELTEQLDARLRIRQVQAAELDRSRRRVVAARDEARELLGRRIRSGVDEPLAWCARRAAGLRGEDIAARGPGLAELTERIDAAIKEFRRIVHGVYPAALTDHGLTAALGNLVAELPRSAAYEATNLPRFAPRIEAGIYFCLVALLEPFQAGDDAADPGLRIQVALTGAELLIRVAQTRAAAGSRQPGWDPASLDAARDRAAALDGTLVLLGGSVAELRVPTDDQTGGGR